VKQHRRRGGSVSERHQTARPSSMRHGPSEDQIRRAVACYGVLAAAALGLNFGARVLPAVSLFVKLAAFGAAAMLSRG
jgi:hypothetical protein